MGTQRAMGLGDDQGMIVEGRLLKPDDRVYDLLDRYVSEPGDFPVTGRDMQMDGHRPSQAGNHGPTGETPAVPQSLLQGSWDRQAMEETMTTIIREIAQEMVPIIAERVIREEIEKLKQADQKLM